jgi:hypothetical protein
MYRSVDYSHLNANNQDFPGSDLYQSKITLKSKINTMNNTS